MGHVYGVPLEDPAAAPCQRILVVENEFLIRFILSDDLRSAGYEIIEACNADEAIAILESSIDVDLVITDVRMPGSLDGLGLLAFVMRVFPSLPVIVTSGHLESRQALACGAKQFVAKPFAFDAVVEAVRAELERSQ